MGRSRRPFAGISFFVLDRVVIPAFLAMAPFACLYAGARTQRLMALTLIFLGAFPLLSIDRPAEQPFEALAPLLVSYLTVALAAAGLLISAGLLNRNRKPPAKLAEPAGAELPDGRSGTPEASRAVAGGNPPLGTALCWLALAPPSASARWRSASKAQPNPIGQRTALGNVAAYYFALFTPGDGTVGLHVLRCTGSASSGSITGAECPLDASGHLVVRPRGAALRGCIAFQRRRAVMGGYRCATGIADTQGFAASPWGSRHRQWRKFFRNEIPKIDLKLGALHPHPLGIAVARF